MSAKKKKMAGASVETASVARRVAVAGWQWHQSTQRIITITMTQKSHSHHHYQPHHRCFKIHIITKWQWPCGSEASSAHRGTASGSGRVAVAPIDAAEQGGHNDTSTTARVPLPAKLIGLQPNNHQTRPFLKKSIHKQSPKTTKWQWLGGSNKQQLINKPQNNKVAVAVAGWQWLHNTTIK
jgi:hypothetical protein